MVGQTLMRASQQWMRRPADERFVSLADMLVDQTARRERSKTKAISSRRLLIEPVDGDKTMSALAVLDRETDERSTPTHWAFQQIAGLASAPAKYLRTLPTPIVADALNYALRYSREIQDIGIMTRSDKEALDGGIEDEYAALAAATGPNYGRVWNADFIEQIINRFGDGITGDWRVPGEFGKAVNVTKANTTLYAGDRDMFVFLADEQNRIEIPDRRNGEPGSLARGFFVWNSEVGSTSFGIATFLFDYVCCNRMVWNTLEYQEVRMRHTVSAPDKFIEEIAPALTAMKEKSTIGIREAITHARSHKLDDVDDFLRNRFSVRVSEAIKAAHIADEDRPIETLYDVTNGITAYARGVNWQDDRVALERTAGKLLAAA